MMKLMQHWKWIVLILLAAIVGAAGLHIQTADHDHGSDHHGDDGHDRQHGSKRHDIDPGCWQPMSVALEVNRDAVRGWNLHITPKHFRFSPESVNRPVGNQNCDYAGHAHLYVNGKKVTRIYSEWYYLPHLPAGESEIRIELNDNSHAVYYDESEPVETIVTVRNDS